MDLSHPRTTWSHICNELPFSSREFVGVADNGDPLFVGSSRTFGEDKIKKRRRRNSREGRKRRSPRESDYEETVREIPRFDVP